MNDHFDLLPCGYISFSDKGSIISYNKTLASWVGYPKEELIGQNIEKIFTLATRIFYNTHFFPLVRLHALANEIFLTLRTKGDKDIPVLANAHLRGEGEDTVIHCSLMIVEERKKFEQELLNAKHEAERALKENNELVDLTRSLEEQAVALEHQYRNQKSIAENLRQFSKIISHDLQEPIRKIQIFADIISRDRESTLSDKSRTLVTKIESSASKLKALTIGLQQYIEIGTEQLHTTVDLRQTIANSVTKAGLAHSFTDFDLHIDDVPRIEGYAAQLELLFFHLADNSIKFRDPNRKLSIKVESLLLDENIFRHNKDRYKYVQHVRVYYKDNGLGFSNEYKDYVFQLLKKVDSSSVGHGFGLPLVKKIVDNHAGEISVASEIGSGTHFEIELPTVFAIP